MADAKNLVLTYLLGTTLDKDGKVTAVQWTVRPSTPGS